MVLGTGRMRLRSDGTGLFAVNSSPIRTIPAADWSTARGTVLFESNVELVGGFPGYAERGCQLENVRLVITDTFLIVDEGQLRGFGMPLRWIESAIIVERPRRHESALRLFYRERGLPRSFTVRFGSSKFGSRGVTRSARALQILRSCGAGDHFAGEAPIEPSFALPWDRAWAFENENAIWTGRAMAPIQVASETTPSDVWLTTKSLIWGGGAGEGLNRIPLTLLMDVVTERLRDRTGTPAIYLSIGDARTGRFEIPFVFDLHEVPDRNFRERGAFLVGLRSRGLPDGKAAPAWQPWRTDSSRNEQVISDGGADTDFFFLEEPEPVPSVIQLFSTDASVPLSLADVDTRPSALVSIDHPPFSIETDQDATDPESPGIPEIDRHDSPFVAVNADPVRSVDELGHDSLGITPFPHSELVESAVVVDVSEPFALLADGPALDFVPETASDDDGLIDEETLASKIEVALSVVELEKNSTERFQHRTSISPGVESPIEDLVLAEWSATDQPFDREPMDLQLVESWVEHPSAALDGPTGVELVTDREVDELVSVSSVGSEARSADIELNPTGDDSGALWVEVRAYEASAIGALAEALRVIDDRVEGRSAIGLSELSPGAWEQARAEIEIKSLIAHGRVSADEAKARRDRLHVLGDVSVRLRTLVELHDSGYLSADELDSKRAQLVKRLSIALIP